MFLTSCYNAGKPKDMADSTYNIGKETVITLDNYIDGSIKANEAKAQLQNQYDRLGEIKPTDFFESANHSTISVSVLLVNIILSDIAFKIKMGEISDKTVDDVLKDRNNIAEKVNVKAR